MPLTKCFPLLSLHSFHSFDHRCKPWARLGQALGSALFPLISHHMPSQFLDKLPSSQYRLLLQFLPRAFLQPFSHRRLDVIPIKFSLLPSLCPAQFQNLIAFQPLGPLGAADVGSIRTPGIPPQCANPFVDPCQVWGLGKSLVYPLLLPLAQAKAPPVPGSNAHTGSGQAPIHPG